MVVEKAVLMVAQLVYLLVGKLAILMADWMVVRLDGKMAGCLVLQWVDSTEE